MCTPPHKAPAPFAHTKENKKREQNIPVRHAVSGSEENKQTVTMLTAIDEALIRWMAEIVGGVATMEQLEAAEWLVQLAG